MASPLCTTWATVRNLRLRVVSFFFRLTHLSSLEFLYSAILLKKQLGSLKKSEPHSNITQILTDVFTEDIKKAGPPEGDPELI